MLTNILHGASLVLNIRPILKIAHVSLGNHHDSKCILKVHPEVPSDGQKNERHHLESTETSNPLERIIQIQVKLISSVHIFNFNLRFTFSLFAPSNIVIVLDICTYLMLAITFLITFDRFECLTVQPLHRDVLFVRIQVILICSPLFGKNKFDPTSLTLFHLRLLLILGNNQVLVGTSI